MHQDVVLVGREFRAEKKGASWSNKRNSDTEECDNGQHDGAKGDVIAVGKGPGLWGFSWEALHVRSARAAPAFGQQKNSW
jgi:hypothetical protein